MRIGIIVPSVKPREFQTRFMSSLDNIKEIAPYSTFLMHYQKGWTEAEMKMANNALAKTGFSGKSIYTEGFSKPYPMIKIRQIAAALDDDVDYYLSMDDDFKFSPGTSTSGGSSGRRYLEAIHFLKHNPQCGTLMCRPFFGGSTFGQKIIPRVNYHWATTCGIFWKNMKKESYLFNLFPEDVLDIPGGCEETLATFVRIAYGYWGATQHNNPTTYQMTDWKTVENISENMHSQKCIDENVGRYIRDRWSNKNWKFTKDDKVCPANVLNLKEYQLQQFSFDYKNISTEQLHKEIKA